MIQRRATEIDRRLVLHQMRVHGIAAGEHLPGKEHDVANVQGAHLGLSNGAVIEISRPVREVPR